MTDISLEAVTGKLNRAGYDAFIQALRHAKSAGNRNVELAHWLFHILQQERTDLSLTVDRYKVDRARLLSDLAGVISGFRKNETDMPGVANNVVDVLDRGWHYATLFFGETQIRTGHVLVAALKSTDLRRAFTSLSKEFDKINVEALTTEHRNTWAGSERRKPAPHGRRRPSVAQIPPVLAASPRSQGYDATRSVFARSDRQSEVRGNADPISRPRQRNPSASSTS